VISSVGAPTDPTEERSATFMFTDERTVRFGCSLDGSPFRSCGRGLFGSASYPGPLARGSHVFAVRAKAGTRVSGQASFRWTIVSGASPVTGAATGTPVPFRISGDVSGLAPGVNRIVPLTLENPNEQPIEVTSVHASIAPDSDPPGCPSEKHVSLAQPTGIATRDPVLVPAHGSVVLREYPRAPRITLLATSSDDDACLGTSFALTYSGSAHS
jgi:hypothetical protein